MRKALLVIASLSWAALAHGAEKPIRPVTASEMAMIKSAMQDVLKDPASATYSDVVVSTREDRKGLVCGRVNSKNGFGGYTGLSWFIGLLAEYTDTTERNFVLMRVDEPGGAESAAKTCLAFLFDDKP